MSGKRTKPLTEGKRQGADLHSLGQQLGHLLPRKRGFHKPDVIRAGTGRTGDLGGCRAERRGPGADSLWAPAALEATCSAACSAGQGGYQAGGSVAGRSEHWKGEEGPQGSRELDQRSGELAKCVTILVRTLEH